MKNLSNYFQSRQGKILQLALGGIMVLFIVIMIGVYLIAKRANPVFLDEKGNPVQSQTETKRY